MALECCKRRYGLFLVGKEPVAKAIAERFTYTFELAIYAFIPVVLVAISLGVISAVNHNKFIDQFMKRAVYSERNIGHFGLASQAYTHFTSPIRRYPDLIVHRLLKKIIEKGHFSPEEIDRYEKELPRIAQHCSKRERIANEAEWDLLDMKKVEYISYHIGEIFDSVITGVTKFGLFVEIPEKMLSGLVHVSTLDDYYEYNETQNILVGKHKKRVFRIGDGVKVRAVHADKTTMEVDFVIVEKENNKNNKRNNSKNKAKKRKKKRRS